MQNTISIFYKVKSSKLHLQEGKRILDFCCTVFYYILVMFSFFHLLIFALFLFFVFTFSFFFTVKKSGIFSVVNRSSFLKAFGKKSFKLGNIGQLYLFSTEATNKILRGIEAQNNSKKNLELTVNMNLKF